MYFQALLQNTIDKEQEARAQQEIEKSQCRVKLYCDHKSFEKKMNRYWRVDKDATLKEATEEAWDVSKTLNTFYGQS